MDKNKDKVEEVIEEEAPDQEKWQKKFSVGGCLDSPVDERDYGIDCVSAISEEFPEEYITEGDVKVLNQKSTSQCHDDKTEVLTRDGWKLFKDVTKEDLLATANPETGEVIYEYPIDLIQYDYQGDMIVGKHRSLNFKVTPNHQMVVRKWNEKKRTLDEEFSFIEAQNLGWYAGLRTEFHHFGESDLGDLILPEEKVSNGNILPEIRIDMHDWVQFLGIYLAEGTAYKSGQKGHWRIQLAAVKKREKDYIRGLLTRIGVKGQNEQKDRFHFHNKRIWKKLEEYGLVGKKSYEKFVPSFIFDLDESYIKNFLYGFAMGDGCFRKNGIITYATSSPYLKDDLSRLLLLCGDWNGTCMKPEQKKVSFVKGRAVIHRREQYTINTWKRSLLSIGRKRNITIEKYEGKVYCATVPTYHTLFTRREGKILFSGNCVAHACATAMAFGEYKAGFSYYDDFSRGMIYGNRSETDYQGEGMYIREALKHLNHEGDCMEKDFSCLADYLTVNAKFKADEEHLKTQAEPYKITNYFRCYNETEVKRAIMNQGAVVMSINIYSGFGAEVKIPKEGEKTQGGHAMCCIGWDKTGWIVRNSWGYYTPQGNVHIPYEYPVKEWWGITVNKNVPEPKKTTIWTKIASFISKLTAWLNKIFSSKSADSIEEPINNDNQIQKENKNDRNQSN